MKIITQSSTSIIKSAQIKEPINTDGELITKSIDSKRQQQDNKSAENFIRSENAVDIKLNLDSQINATVLAIKDKNTYVFLLEDGKTLEMSIDADKALKIDSQVIISLDNTQIIDVTPINHAQGIKFDNTKPLLTLLNNLSGSESIKNIKSDEIPLIIQTNTKDIIKAKLHLVGSIEIQTEPTETIKPNIQNIKIALNTKNENPIQLNTLTDIPQTNEVKNITFKQDSIDIIFNAIKNITNTKNNEITLKITEQPSLNEKTVAIKNNIKLTFNLKTEETVLSSIAEFKQNPKQPTQIIKTDSNNEVTSISISSNNLKAIAKEVQSALIQKLETTPKDTKIQIPVKIDGDKIKIPSLNNVIIQTDQLKEIPKEFLNKNITPKLIINKDQIKEIFIQIENKQFPINIKSVEIPLNNKENLVKNVFKILSNSKINNQNSQQIEFNSPNNGKIELKIPNNIFNKENITFEIKDNKHLIAKLDEKNHSIKHITDKHELLKTSEVANPISQQIEAQSPIPKMGKDFVADTLILLKAIIKTSQKSTDLEKPIDKVFEMLNNSINQQHKPSLQITNIDDNNSWRFFTFPYQHEEETKQGEVLYQKQKDNTGDNITNLAFKVNFSKIGDTIVKIKLKNKQININVLLSNDLDEQIKENLINICNLRFKKSDFWGTVDIKKANNLNQPLLKSKKIIYSSQIINIEI